MTQHATAPRPMPRPRRLSAVLLRLPALLVLLSLPLAARAQQMPATLVADRVTVTGDNILTAAGNIEVFHNGTRMTAGSITYERDADRLTITGPILISDPTGGIITATAARLDPRLENGVLLGARLVLDRQLQLAANQIDRAEGRYAQLYKTAVTSCTVCSGRAPLWEIRAEKVVHDQQQGQLYFRNASFWVRGVPLAYIPAMRLPDPSVNRATGLLIPRVRSTDLLGLGLKWPYFITLGSSRDLTLTPYLSSKTRTLELRYRQAFAAGDFSLHGALSDDSLMADNPRGYLFAEGHFDLPGSYKLGFSGQTASDDAYLLAYGYSDLDRLATTLSLTRVQPGDLLDANLTYYQTLRRDERNAALPPIVIHATQRQHRALWGGRLSYGLSADAIVRYGTATGTNGRDVARLGAAADWSRTWITPAGLAATGTAALAADSYLITDAEAFPRELTRAVPQLALTLRYPLTRQSGNAAHLIEPVAMLAWSDSYGSTPPPNEDSTRPEFDTGNLLALSRFPGEDAVETGARAALGLSYTRIGAGGRLSALSFGRVLNDAANPGFTVTSGQQQGWSDWLVAGQVDLGEGLRLQGRGLLDDGLSVTLAQALVDWQRDDLSLSAAYLYQIADPEVGRGVTLSEWTLSADVQLSNAWAVSAGARYDLVADSPARAALGLTWRNECVNVDLSVSRRYTSSTTVEPSTDYGLSVSLAGFSAADATGRPAARCTN